MQQQQSQEQQMRFAIMIRAIRVKSVKSRNLIKDFCLLIEHIMQYEDSSVSLSSKTTRIIPKSNSIWMQDFYYNNCQYSSRFQFTLQCNQTVQLESVTIQGKQIFSNFKTTSQYAKQDFNLKFKDKTGSEVIAEIEISIFQNGDCITGLQPPEISLANMMEPINTAQFSAIEVRKTLNFNLFSCMDQPLTGFDHLECFPRKFKTRNRHQQVQ